MNDQKSELIAILGGDLDTELLTREGYQYIECNAWNDFVGTRLDRFRNFAVIIVYANRYQRIQGLIAARYLLEIAESVKMLEYENSASIDLNAFFASARSVPESLSSIPDKEFQAMIDYEKDPEIHPTQDFMNGVLYYGLMLNRSPHIITSEQKLLSFLEAGKESVILLQDHLYDARMTPEAVIEFLATENSDNLTNPFEEIVDYLRRFIYLPEVELYDVLAVWVMGSYLYRIFRYYGYLHLQAEKASGKTLLMELMAPIAFNGTLLTNPNASSVLKTLDRNSATLFIDETENLSKEQTGSKIELMSVLKTGFNRSGQVTRGDKTFRTYGPKCFAGINDLDDVLADRTITIRLLRKTIREKVELYRENPAMLKQQSDLRDKLYVWALRNGPPIASAYSMEEGHYDSLPHLTNRAFDIWVPLFKIAETIPNEEMRMRAFHSLDKCSQLDVRRRIKRDAEENDSTSLLFAFEVMMRELKPLRKRDMVEYYDPDSVHFFLQKGGYLPRGMQKKGLSRFLKRTLDIDSVPMTFGELTKRMYAVDIELLNEYRRRYLNATNEMSI